MAQSAQNKQENISDMALKERLSGINSSFQNEESASRFWYWGFLSLYTVGTAAQLTLFFNASNIERGTDKTKRDHFQQDMMTGAITTGLGAIFMAISPMPSMYARNILATMPDDTADSRMAKLRKAEDLLRDSAQWEADNTSLLMHSANFAVNLAAGLVIWLAFNRPVLDGLITFLPGFAIGEIMIFTQPVSSMSDWRKYDSKYNSKVSYDYRNKKEENRLHIAAAPGGLMAIYEY